MKLRRLILIIFMLIALLLESFISTKSYLINPTVFHREYGKELIEYEKFEDELKSINLTFQNLLVKIIGKILKTRTYI